MRNYIIKTVLILVALFLCVTIVAEAVPINKPKLYDGIITHIDMTSGSFVLRLRNGDQVTVKTPIEVNNFISIKGVLDTIKGTIEEVSEIKLKDKNGSDIIPNILVLNPGSSQVGEKITIIGTGFTKKGNSVTIGNIQNAIMNLTSKDGKTITFGLPPTPCNQKTKLNCMVSVIPAGIYDITVSNINGISNPVPFQIIPLPPLTILTDILPQVTAGMRYQSPIIGIGGAEAYSWRISAGMLPPGLILAQSACKETPCKTNAIVSGTPTTPGVYQFTVTLISGQENISRQFIITVVQPINERYY
ncbi:MAG: putative Ig domain-containing protein [Patescibacteria group bacterium]|nr:putative Ig domain-containing protein [Patescibacteria group bacterium]